MSGQGDFCSEARNLSQPLSSSSSAEPMTGHTDPEEIACATFLGCPGAFKVAVLG